MDQHQVRRWTSWHRWTTLAIFLAVARAGERDHTPAPAGLIELTVNDFRRLFDALQLATSPTVDRLLHWSPGGDDTKPEPATATTNDTFHTNDHELRLQY